LIKFVSNLISFALWLTKHGVFGVVIAGSKITPLDLASQPTPQLHSNHEITHSMPNRVWDYETADDEIFVFSLAGTGRRPGFIDEENMHSGL
jgi:hypothetical protein